jgi:peptide/nickel transport system permease protein
MTRYILKRLLQGIPLLFFISLILFLLMMNVGDPVATMGGRRVTRQADKDRLRRQLGLDKPLIVQYAYWLVGNDWAKTDLDGDGIAETSGTRRGVLRGDFGISLLNRMPVLEVSGERLHNTLIIMLASDFVIILGALLVGVYSALRQYSFWDNFITAILFIGYSMPIFFIALISMYLEFSSNASYPICLQSGCSPQEGKITRCLAHGAAVLVSIISSLLIAANPQYHAGSDGSRLYPHG